MLNLQCIGMQLLHKVRLVPFEFGNWDLVFISNRILGQSVSGHASLKRRSQCRCIDRGAGRRPLQMFRNTSATRPIHDRSCCFLLGSSKHDKNVQLQASGGLSMLTTLLNPNAPNLHFDTSRWSVCLLVHVITTTPVPTVKD